MNIAGGRCSGRSTCISEHDLEEIISAKSRLDY
jgi:hypothetical protein